MCVCVFVWIIRNFMNKQIKQQKFAIYFDLN